MQKGLHQNCKPFCLTDYINLVKGCLDQTGDFEFF